MYALSARRAKALALVASFSLLQACTSPSANLSGASVEEAFLSTGFVPAKPYTRSIINSNNF